ncbi:MAG: hypothetical protein AB7G04_00270 [Hyphomonadaceae bacterium]
MRKRHILPADKPTSRFVSSIYDDIYSPVAARASGGRLERKGYRRDRRLSAGEKHARKVKREIETTLRSLDQQRPRMTSKQRKKNRARAKAWYAANTERAKDNMRAWRRKNPRYSTQSERDRTARDPAAASARNKAYRQANLEKLQAKDRARDQRRNADPARKAYKAQWARDKRAAKNA